MYTANLRKVGGSVMLAVPPAILINTISFSALLMMTEPMLITRSWGWTPIMSGRFTAPIWTRA